MKKISNIIVAFNALVFILVFSKYEGVKNNIQPQSKVENKVSIQNNSSIKLLISNIAVNEAPPVKPDYTIIDAKLTLEKLYTTISDLENDSDIIIEGIVRKNNYSMYFGIPITISRVEVLDIYKNNEAAISKGETVNILEGGGIMSKESVIKMFKDKFPDKPLDEEKIKPMKYTNDGIPTLEPEEHVLIFAQKYNGPATNLVCYSVLGAYQGKFKITNNEIIHLVPTDIQIQFKDKVKTKQELIDKLKDK